MTSPAVDAQAVAHMARARGWPDKADARGDLVGKGERQGYIGVEVHDPPRLVLEPPPGGPDRGNGHHDQQAESDGGGEHVGVGGQEDPHLAQRTRLRGLRIAEGDQHDVGADEPKRPWCCPAVPANEPVLADSSFEPGHAGDEQQHDKHEVGAGETGEPAAGDEQAPRGR